MNKNRKNNKIHKNKIRRKKYHKKHDNSKKSQNDKFKNLQENITNKAKEYINEENIKKIKDTAGKSFEKAKNFTSENIDKFQKYLDEQDFKGKFQNIANAGIDKIKEHSKKRYISRLLIFLHKHYILNFSILFIIAILVFRNIYIYISHNQEVEKILNYSITNYTPSLDNIIVAKEDYYTNMIIRQISSNKTATNNIILRSSSINDLEESLKNVFDNYNRNLETSLNETIKSSNKIMNFLFAFLTVIIIIFTLVGIIINNRIIKAQKIELINLIKHIRKN